MTTMSTDRNECDDYRASRRWLRSIRLAWPLLCAVQVGLIVLIGTRTIAAAFEWRYIRPFDLHTALLTAEFVAPR